MSEMDLSDDTIGQMIVYVMATLSIGSIVGLTMLFMVGLALAVV